MLCFPQVFYVTAFGVLGHHVLGLHSSFAFGIFSFLSLPQEVAKCWRRCVRGCSELNFVMCCLMLFV